MKTFALSVVISLAAATVLGQAVDLQVLKRAQRLNNQDDARQGSSAPAPAVQPNPAPPADPVLTATLQNIASLQKDFASLKSEPAQKQQLVNDLTTAAHGAKPSKASISKLADDLTEALAGKSFSHAQQTKLAQDVHAIFNSAHLSPTQQQTIIDDVQRILRSNEVSSDITARVVKDVQKIAGETK